MKDNQILQKWKEHFKNDKLVLKEIMKLEKIDVEKTNFFSACNVVDERINTSFGVGLNKLNKITIRALVFNFIQMQQIEENDLILVSSDGTEIAKSMIKQIAFLKLNKGKLITFSEYNGVDKKIFGEAFKKLKIAFGIFIQKSVYDSQLFDIYFVNNIGENLSNDNVVQIVNKTHQNDYFAVPLLHHEQMLFIDTMQIIKNFVKKILPLYTKKISTNKTKIVISNHNPNVCKTLSKILGNLDFSYIVYNKPLVKNIYKSNFIDDKKMHWIFKDEILFALRKNANVLISFNENGSQLFCFIKIKKQFVYLNENVITLLTLHNFLNNLIITKQKKFQFLISSNMHPTKPIENLIQKYKLNFEIKQNLSINENDYLLLYWNNYNQFAFGEKRNSHYSIYHILIKLLEVVNFYHLQYGTINSILSDLSFMYGSSFEKRMLYKTFSKQNIIQKLNYLQKNHSKNDLQKNFHILSIEESKENNIFDEEILFLIKLDDDSSLEIKWNQILNKIILFHRCSQVKKWWNFHQNHKLIDIKSLIKKIIK